MTDKNLHGPVVICGMSRSGSTWLFNAARLLLNWPGYWCDDWAERDRCIVKVHDWLPYGPALVRCASKILGSRRSLGEIARSMARMGWNRPVADVLAVYQSWTPYVNYEMDYGQLQTNPTGVIKAVATVLDVTEYDCAAIAAQLDQLRYDPNNDDGRGWDTVTMMHPKHRTGLP